ncbi:MAG: hypothetical protein K0R90_1796 [Oscillospiraceae bacterium]|jgi:ribosome-associated protein|nr:hypothetical protein [Oscillospiraceae bacterium]
METHMIEIRTESIKLDQLLKFVGFAETGGHAKEIIAEGIVFVNDEICLQRGKKIHDGDKVVVEGYEFIIRVAH